MGKEIKRVLNLLVFICFDFQNDNFFPEQRARLG